MSLKNIQKKSDAMGFEAFEILQDKQREEVSKATEYFSNKEYEKAKSILEKIIYEDGHIVREKTALHLISKTYLKLKEYDKCWKYTNFIFKEDPEFREATRKIQAQVLYETKRYQGAIQIYVIAEVISHRGRKADQENRNKMFGTNYAYEVTKEQFNKGLKKYLKKLEKEENVEHIAEYYYSLFDEAIKMKKFDEKAFNMAISTVFKS